jgi:hypothetical protein
MKPFLKPFFVVVGITSMISLAATTPSSSQKPNDDHKLINLKVLPKEITYHEVDSIMDNFKAALGVKCDYCHARSKDNPKKLDFASDEKEYKLTAREMMKMTDKINKKYFKEHEGNENVGAIQCMSCHRGKEKPEFQLRPPKTSN